MKAYLEGRLETRNKLRHFADGLLSTQDALFALQEISQEERATLSHCEIALASVERFLTRVTEKESIDHLKKIPT